MDFPGDSAVKNLPANAKDAYQSLGQEDQPLKKETATHSSITPRKSHGQRRLAGYGLWGRKCHDWATKQQLLYIDSG